MHWFWQHIVHKRDERSRSIFFTILLFFIILTKVYVTHFYRSNPIRANGDILAKLQWDTLSKSQFVDRSHPPKTKRWPTKESKRSTSFTKKPQPSTKPKTPFTKDKPSFKTFIFDPNTISKDSLKLLGFNPVSIKSILNYRAKKGIYRSAEQLRKVYGTDDELLDRLIPLVDISPTFKKRKFTKIKPKVIDINLADTTDFKSLYGIGPTYARRIINYRTHLGGFVSVDQIGETYGIPDSTFQKIVPYLNFDPKNFKKANINTTTKDELAKHPYIRRYQAKVIKAYQEMHGYFKHIDHLHRLYGLEDAEVDTIKMYFDVK